MLHEIRLEIEIHPLPMFIITRTSENPDVFLIGKIKSSGGAWKLMENIPAESLKESFIKVVNNETEKCAEKITIDEERIINIIKSHLDERKAEEINKHGERMKNKIWGHKKTMSDISRYEQYFLK